MQIFRKRSASGTPAGAGLKGTLLGLFAAVCYGFIPFFTLPISHSGDPADKLPDISILFYRFLLAAAILGVVQLVRRASFRITRPEAVTLLYLAFISDGSALFLLAGDGTLTPLEEKLPLSGG